MISLEDKPDDPIHETVGDDSDNDDDDDNDNGNYYDYLDDNNWSVPETCIVT
jgi:hypothetical protein